MEHTESKINIPIRWEILRGREIQIVGDWKDGALLIVDGDRIVDGWGWELITQDEEE